MVTTPVLVTYEESLRRPESSREEVTEGELHIMPLASFAHNLALRRIQQMLDRSLDVRFDLIWDTGFLIAKLPRLRYRIPDIAIVDKSIAESFLAERTERDSYARFAPMAVIEILSPANRKGSVGQLLQDYVDLGVKQIAFLDPGAKSVLMNGECSSALTIANVSIDVGSIWSIFT